MSSGDLTLDVEARQLWVRGSGVDLTYKEFEALTVLLQRCDAIVPQKTISLALWGSAGHAESKRLVKIIERLRQKLGSATPSIVSVRSRGYGLLCPRKGACSKSDVQTQL